MYPHRIRLRGPWDCTPLAPPGDLRRVTMPSIWPHPGLVRFTRRFGYPGRLDDWERVWLTFAGFTGRAAISVNQTHLGHFAAGPLEFEITSLLKSRNELIAEMETDSSDGGLWGEVALEVRCQAYLRDVRATINDGRLRVSGELVGEMRQPLELYVRLNNANVIYQVLAALGPFQASSDALDNRPPSQELHSARVELVHVATVWQVQDVDAT